MGALLGYCQATAQEAKRTIALIGDGALQVAAQEIGTMLRYHLNPIIFVLNNQGYMIEEQIHPGAYNYVQPWRYSRLVEVLHGGVCSAGNSNEQQQGIGSHNQEQKQQQWGWGCQVRTEMALMAAMQEALQDTERLCLIEVVLDRDDCTPEMLEFGARVSMANQRPYQRQ